MAKIVRSIAWLKLARLWADCLIHHRARYHDRRDARRNFITAIQWANALSRRDAARLPQ